jgi:hypothetical protein
MARNKKLRRLDDQAKKEADAKAPRKVVEVAPPVPVVVPEPVAPLPPPVKKKRTRFVFTREKKEEQQETKAPALPTARPTFAGKLLTKNVKPLPKPPEPGKLI